MKTSFLLCSLLLPVAATAQKLKATAPPRTLRVGSEKAPLYYNAADTAKKTGFFLSPGSQATVVGEFSSRWSIVKREGFFFLTPTSKLLPESTSLPSSNVATYLARVSAADKAEAAALDGKNGFRDYHLGDELSKFQGLKKIEGKGRSEFYINPTDNLRIGEAEISEISYGFYKGKLSSIIIQTKGLINSKRVREALVAQYGEGFKGNKLIEEYYWSGEQVTLMYDENSLSHDATIVFHSKALKAQEKADDKEAAKKATSDL